MGGLTIGETYYLRVFTQSSNDYAAKFSICISETAVNNQCWSAIDVPVNNGPGCSVFTTGTTIGSTVSSQVTCNNLYTYPPFQPELQISVTMYGINLLHHLFSIG